MQLTIAFRHLDSSSFVRDHVEDKLQKLPRFFSKEPVKVHVVITREKSRYQVEFVVSAESMTFTATGNGEDLYVMIDETYQRLEQQCRRHKDKLKDHKSIRQEPGILDESSEMLQSSL